MPVPLGLLVPLARPPAGDPGHLDENAAGLLGLAARWCDLCLVDLRGLEAGRGAEEWLGALRLAVDRAARDGGRLPGEVALHAVLGPSPGPAPEMGGSSGADREERLVALASACGRAGWSGALLDWRGGPADLGRWRARLEAVGSEALGAGRA